VQVRAGCQIRAAPVNICAVNMSHSDWTEDERLARLRAYDILDTPPEKEFDDLAELASRLCGTPMSTVTLVDASRQWFKARKGMEATETPRDVSICSEAMLEPDIFEVLDTKEDPRFRSSGLMRSGSKLRYYAGAPLVTDDRVPLGTLCVLDEKPRDPLTPLQRFALQTLARQVMARIELRRALQRERADAEALKIANDLLEGRIEATSLELRMNRDALRKAQMAQPAQLLASLAELINTGSFVVTGTPTSVCLSQAPSDVGMVPTVKSRAQLENDTTLRIYV
jgi:GAF domain-containing protein